MIDSFSDMISLSLVISLANIAAFIVISCCMASTLAYYFCNLTSKSIFSSSQSCAPAVYGLLFLSSSLSSATKLSRMLISFLSLSTSSLSPILSVLPLRACYSSRFSVLSFSSSNIPSLALYVSFRVFSSKASSFAITFSYFLIVSLYKLVF